MKPILIHFLLSLAFQQTWLLDENCRDTTVRTGGACLFIPECPSPEVPDPAEHGRGLTLGGKGGLFERLLIKTKGQEDAIVSRTLCGQERETQSPDLGLGFRFQTSEGTFD